MNQLKDQKSSQKIKFIGELAIIFFIVSRVMATIFSFPCITDVELYLSLFRKLQIESLQPYSGFSLEYPPLTLIAIYLPGLAKENIQFSDYYIFFSFMMFFFDALCLKLCRVYCRNNLQLNEEEISYMTIIYSLFGLLMFHILYHRLDVVVALFFVASLFLFQAQNSKLKISFIANSLSGFFYKITPVLNVPIAIIFKAFAKARNVREFIKITFINSAIFSLLLIGIIFALEIYTNHTFIKNLTVHARRGIQIESIYGSFLMFKNLLLNKVSTIANNFGSWNIEASSGLEIFLKFFGSLLLLFFYGALFFIFARKKIRQEKIIISDSMFLEATLISILLFITFQRVFSPQYLIWFIPLSAIWLTKNREAKFLAIFSFLFCATAVIFASYFSLINEVPFLVILLFCRNFVLLLFTIFLIKKFFNNLLKNDFQS